MQLYEQDEKGLFTFYREQDEFQQNLKKRLNDREISKLQDLSNFKGQAERLNVMRKRKLKKQNTQPRLSNSFMSKKMDENNETREYDRCPDTTAHIEKSRLNRNHKLLKMSLKKTQSDDQNAKDLKNHLKELLKTEESDLQAFEQTKVEHTYKQTQKKSLQSKNKYLCQLLNPNDACQQESLKVVMPGTKLAIPSRPPKQPIHQLNNIVFPKSFQQVKQRFSQKFPRINKKSLSQKIRHSSKVDTTLLNLNSIQKTRYLSPTREIQQQYLEPICTQRKKKVSYALNIEYFNPNRISSKKNFNNQKALTFISSENHSGKEEALRNMAKNIKFK